MDLLNEKIGAGRGHVKSLIENPYILIGALSVLFSKYSEVKSAYLSEVVLRDGGEKVFVIGLDLGGGIADVFAKISDVLSKVAPDLPAKVLVFGPEDQGVGALLRAAGEPFYDSKRGTRLFHSANEGQA